MSTDAIVCKPCFFQRKMIHIKAIWISWVSPQFSQFYLGHFWVSLLDKTMHSVLVGTWEYFFFQNEKKKQYDTFYSQCFIHLSSVQCESER
jgi:hypothetical protein